ncbi:phosphatase PAP2 family protein [Halarchaeum sp. P4]|uniref:phosphatase PAP2 family protein n=1 Tax=Halarchaeum sp. P4 TaxID=3421639 RepID=UPI003EBA3232
MRGVGVTGALTDAVPPALVPVLEVLTQLGDAWFVLVAVASVHWLAPRYGLIDERDALRYVALGFAIFGTVVGLKAVFALGRPPASVALVAHDGYGFPSGHAVSSAALYGGAAALLSRPRCRHRWLAAAGLVTLVCATRLLLGVHFLVDVVAGVAAGAVLAGVVLAVTREGLLPGYALAAALGVFGLGVAGSTVEALAACGLGVGGLVTIVAVTRRPTVVRGPVRPLIALCGYVVVGGLALAALKAPLPVYGVLITSGVAGAGVVALPATRLPLQNFSR